MNPALLEQQRRELRQVVAPVEPGVAALGLPGGHVELVLPEHVDGRLGGLDEEVLLAAAEPDELQALVGALSGDFKSIEPNLLALDKHLTLRTYLNGTSLGEIDEKIWVPLAGNRVAAPFIRKGTLVNLLRWFLFIEQSHPEIQGSVKAAKAATQAKLAAGSKAGASYNLGLQDVEKGVVTRFLPEPSCVSMVSVWDVC